MARFNLENKFIKKEDYRSSKFRIDLQKIDETHLIVNLLTVS